MATYGGRGMPPESAHRTPTTRGAYKHTKNAKLPENALIIMKDGICHIFYFKGAEFSH